MMALDVVGIQRRRKRIHLVSFLFLLLLFCHYLSNPLSPLLFHSVLCLIIHRYSRFGNEFMLLSSIVSNIPGVVIDGEFWYVRLFVCLLYFFVFFFIFNTLIIGSVEHPFHSPRPS